MKVYIQNLGYGSIVAQSKSGARIRMPDGTVRYRPRGTYIIIRRRTR